jgi:hypothetical protein
MEVRQTDIHSNYMVVGLHGTIRKTQTNTNGPLVNTAYSQQNLRRITIVNDTLEAKRFAFTRNHGLGRGPMAAGRAPVWWETKLTVGGRDGWIEWQICFCNSYHITVKWSILGRKRSARWGWWDEIVFWWIECTTDWNDWNDSKK